MSATTPVTRLVFVGEFSEREASEALDRGYLSHVLVEVDGDLLYPVVFYDCTRLQQDLEMSTKHGRAFVADPGMIVLTDITLDAMRKATQSMCEEGFFEHMVAVIRECLAEAVQHCWPPKIEKRT
jgi:hypothetical protein